MPKVKQKPKYEVSKEDGDWTIYKTVDGVQPRYNNKTKELVYKANYKRPKGSKQRFNRQRLQAQTLKEAKREVADLKKSDLSQIANTKIDKNSTLRAAYKATVLDSHKISEADLKDYNTHGYKIMKYFDNHLNKEFGNRRIGSLQDRDIERMGEMLNNDNLSQNTMDNIKSVLRRAFLRYTGTDIFAIISRKSWIAHNAKKPIDIAHLINRTGKNIIEIQKEIVQGIDSYYSPQYKNQPNELKHIKTVVKIAIATGRRISELIKTKVQDIDFSKGLVQTFTDNTKTDIDEVYLIPPSLLKELKANPLFDPNGTIGIFVQGTTYSRKYKKVLKEVLNATDEEMSRKAVHKTRALMVTSLVYLGTDPNTADGLISHKGNRSSIMLAYQLSGSLYTAQKKILKPYWDAIGL